MTTATGGKPVREGSAEKRTAILQAARELFLADGFDRVSVDAVSARAHVSKRTVYDYFGDKQSLLSAVIDNVITSLLDSVKRAISDNLTDFTDLADALVGFSSQVSLSTLGSSDYSDLMRLLGPDRSVAALEHAYDPNTPEDLLVEKFVELGEKGLIDVPRPRLAVDHFVALTLYPSVTSMEPAVSRDAREAKQAIVDGVDVFLRAYGGRAAQATQVPMRPR